MSELIDKALADCDDTDVVIMGHNVLGETGRVLLRPSGTEPVVRVMVEAPDEETAGREAEALADVVQRELRLHD